MMSREEWLRHAVELIDKYIFEGDLQLDVHHDFQIACGRCKGKAVGESIFPFEGDNFNDFFPVTIHINCNIKDEKEMLYALIHECIHAFFDIRKHKKSFILKAKTIGFEKPYNKPNPSQWLIDNTTVILNMLKQQYGSFPGKAVIEHKKEKNSKKQKSTMSVFCSSCGYDIKIKRKVFEKYKGTPTCMCGAKMIIDLEEDEDTEN